MSLEALENRLHHWIQRKKTHKFLWNCNFWPINLLIWSKIGQSLILKRWHKNSNEGSNVHEISRRILYIQRILDIPLLLVCQWRCQSTGKWVEVTRRTSDTTECVHFGQAMWEAVRGREGLFKLVGLDCLHGGPAEESPGEPDDEKYPRNVNTADQMWTRRRKWTSSAGCHRLRNVRSSSVLWDPLRLN